MELVRFRVEDFVTLTFFPQLVSCETEDKYIFLDEQ